MYVYFSKKAASTMHFSNVQKTSKVFTMQVTSIFPSSHFIFNPTPRLNFEQHSPFFSRVKQGTKKTGSGGVKPGDPEELSSDSHCVSLCVCERQIHSGECCPSKNKKTHNSRLKPQKIKIKHEKRQFPTFSHRQPINTLHKRRKKV